MVSDNLVCSDKIGSNMLFWSFPSASSAALKLQHASKTSEQNELVSKVQVLETEIEEASKDKEASVSLTLTPNPTQLTEVV